MKGTEWEEDAGVEQVAAPADGGRDAVTIRVGEESRWKTQSEGRYATRRRTQSGANQGDNGIGPSRRKKPNHVVEDGPAPSEPRGGGEPKHKQRARPRRQRPPASDERGGVEKSKAVADDRQRLQEAMDAKKQSI